MCVVCVCVCSVVILAWSAVSLEPDTQWYVTTRSITASEGHDDELSLPSGVVVRVVETCTTGWWKVR